MISTTAVNLIFRKKNQNFGSGLLIVHIPSSETEFAGQTWKIAGVIRSTYEVTVPR